MIEKPIVADALLSLSPNAQFVVDDGNVLWYSPDIPQPSEEEINTELARLQAEYNAQAYARARAEAYASIADQLDMQYWDSVNGSRTWLDHIEAVKEAHPK